MGFSALCRELREHPVDGEHSLERRRKLCKLLDSLVLIGILYRNYKTCNMFVKNRLRSYVRNRAKCYLVMNSVPMDDLGTYMSNIVKALSKKESDDETVAEWIKACKEIDEDVMDVITHMVHGLDEQIRNIIRVSLTWTVSECGKKGCHIAVQ